MKWKGEKWLKETDGTDREREEFLCYAADRLKTPVTVMGLALQRLEDVQTEEERQKFLEMAKRGQQEINLAVEEVLKAARQKKRLF